MMDPGARRPSRGRWRPRYPLVAVLAVPLVAAAVHLALGRPSKDGFTIRECLVCGKVLVVEPEIRAFGLVPLPRIKSIEDNECSRFLARRFRVACGEHQWEYCGSTRTRPKASEETFVDSWGGRHLHVTTWGPAFTALLDRLSACKSEVQDLRLWVACLIKHDTVFGILAHHAEEVVKYERPLERASAEELKNIHSFRDLLPPSVRDRWQELRTQILSEVGRDSTCATVSGS